MAGPTTAQRGERNPAAESGRGRSQGQRKPPGRLRPRTRRLVILVLAVLLLLAGGGIWALYGSSWLRVTHIRTTGTQVLTRDQVESAAAVPIGDPLISVDTDAMENRLRKKLPRIDSVVVTRSWPHDISLKVTERKPVLLMKSGGKFTEVDAKGVRFATVESAPRRVPVLELTAGQSPSTRRFGADRLRVEAVRVARELPSAVARDTLFVRVSSYDSISLELTGHRTVAWGSGEFGTAKARALMALMKAAPKAAHFDVSAPTAPAVSGS
ncbi:FtsQ-type POTRA domain-containing protein [Streptomyces sp. SID10853]|uniref:FtsQ-type POTRA domain-containing protein n=1 Tax=Streptomyces sp. SID10853 TaxID=2706028 RepID=UPI0013BFC87E|nr:FtsQ-type POTRA domain-containing protein [Streptomyces sp. SID10853]